MIKNFKLGIMGKKKESLGDMKNEDGLEGINIGEVGCNWDGCFGIGYELWSKECKVWGEWELCGLKMWENMNMRRKEVEEKNE